MKNKMKFALAFILVLFTFKSLESKEYQSPKFIIVCEINNYSNMIVTSEKLIKFLIENDLVNYIKNADTKFTNFKVIKKENKHYKAKDVYYLFARDNQGSKTYAFELTTRVNKLIFNSTSMINICECKQKDETAFTFDTSGIITGCVEGNHTITKQEEN
ncbi:MAG: hypothetical protein NTZ33_09265 [Bacteroidetes bacterium]|nr:hypothetical protein [Bacteroidota bacterium]